MNALLNRNFLESIGVAIDEQTFQMLSRHYEETLDERVITEIVEELDEAQLTELTSLRGGETGALQQWLETNVPQLSEIIEDEIAILLGDMAERSDELV